MAQPPTILPPSAAASRGRPIESEPADLLGDPTQLDGIAPPELSPGEADELIAKLADAQIDQMLADAESDVAPRRDLEPPRSPMIEVPAALAVESPMLATTPLEAIVTPEESAALRETLPEPQDPIVAPPTDSLSSVEAPLAFPASFSPPMSKRPHVSAVLTSSSASTDAPREEPLAGTLTGTLDAPKSADDPAVSPDLVDAMSAAQHEVRSDAEAVAKELAEDALRSLPRNNVTPEPHAHHVGASGIAIVPTTWHRVTALPMTMLDIVNYPVHSLSDKAREVIGAIAVVTLANATALLIYLALFR